MLQSMTGFGRGEAVSGGVAVVVELRSVNHRYLDVVIRGPREYLPLEARLQRMVKEAFRRGRVEVHVKRQATQGGQVVKANASLYRAYRDAIDDLLGGDADDAVRAGAVGFVLSQPSVLSVTTDQVDVVAEEDVVITALEGAIDDLASMRNAEGNALGADLDRHLLALAAELDAVDKQLDGLTQRLRERLEARLSKLLKERLEPFRLAQEAAVLAEKADVSEEVARLRSHLVQVKDALERGLEEPVGRRLDFLLQEMNREVNTIGSKSAEHPVTHRVVEMKSILERMREQAANVE